MTGCSYTLEEVVSFPKPLAEGVLYISKRFAVSAHMCACGCGTDVILALSPAQWRLTRHADGTASLSPSVDNSSFPCRAHYWIRHGRADWYAQLTDGEVKRARVRDRRARDAYYRQLNAPRALHERVWNWLKSLITPASP